MNHELPVHGVPGHAMPRPRVGLVLLALFASACGYPVFDAETGRHVLTVDEYGHCVDTRKDAVGPWTCDQQIDAMIDSILRGTDVDHAAGRRRRVMIFAHGGLNSWDASSSTIHDVMQRMEKAGGGSGTPYPVFMQWNSEAVHCLNEHLWFIRQGQVRRDFWLLAAPLFLVEDIGKGLISLPTTWIAEIENAFNTAPGMKTNAKARHQFYADNNPVDAARLGRGCDPNGGLWSETGSWAGRIIYFPLRVLSMPLVDGLGTPAWENMIRRTRMLLHTEEEFKVRNGRMPPGSGAMANFLRRLEDLVVQNGGPDDWDITLVGHSLGTIVCCETLRVAPSLPIRNIAFMAAACSLREYRESVLPFLTAPEHQDAAMHHLVLSDWCEENESWPCRWFEFAPRGSLLVWIDSFFTSPSTLLDRTAGRYVNLMAATHLDDSLPAAVRERITVRQFSSGKDQESESPQKHGEFIDKVDFWKPDSWLPDPPCHE